MRQLWIRRNSSQQVAVSSCLKPLKFPDQPNHSWWSTRSSHIWFSGNFSKFLCPSHGGQRVIISAAQQMEWDIMVRKLSQTWKHIVHVSAQLWRFRKTKKQSIWSRNSSGKRIGGGRLTGTTPQSVGSDKCWGPPTEQWATVHNGAVCSVARHGRGLGGSRHKEKICR